MSMKARTYENDAARQRAYRERLRVQRAAPPPKPTKAPPRSSRPARILALAMLATDLADEYGTWLAAIPENLSGGSLAEELETAISQLGEVVEILESIEPPRIGR